MIPGGWKTGNGLFLAGRILFLFLFMSFLFVRYASADGGDISIVASVSPAKGRVGTGLEYRVRVSGDDAASLSVNLPGKGDVFPEDEKKQDKDGGVTVVPLYSVLDTGREEKEGAIDYIVRMAYYRTGTFVLPELDIKDAAGIRTGYRIPSVTIDALNPAGEFQEIEGPVDVPHGWTGPALFALAVLALGSVAGIFIYRYLKSRKKDEPVATLPPLALFLRALESKKPEMMIEENRAEEYADALSGLFRDYLAGMYGIDTREMTTGELRRALLRPMRAAGFSHRLDEIMDFFELWDLAKYAEFAPSREILSRNLTSVRQMARLLSPGGGDV